MERQQSDTVAPVRETGRAAAGPGTSRTQVVQRVLKRRSYAAQKALLKAGKGAAVGPGEEAELARAGFASPGREVPHRQRLEEVFGQSLGHVRAHTGPEAAQASAAMGAEAYALGTEVAFEHPEPSLETAAHEVAHVVQQSPGVHRLGGAGAGAGEADLEREAEGAARVAVAGGRVRGMSRDRPAVRKKERLPQGKEAFEKMWAAHPHNYTGDPSQDTSSADLLESIGLPTDWNTCAIRLSVMLNTMGLKITPAKVKAAGIPRAPYYSRKTKQYYILSAKEMWTYLQKNFRKADVVFPTAGGTYRDAAAFGEGFRRDIEPIVKGRKGIVAFEKIFGYGGTGHVDLFDGLRLSDAPNWYPSARLHLWYVVVPDERGGL